MKTLIVEDEPLAAERLKDYVGRIPTLQLLGTFDNALDAMAFLKQNPVDLLFLDINLGDISGIKMLEVSDIKAQVILTTAYHEFALKGYELDVCDYLLKPFSFERFSLGVDKARSRSGKAEVARDHLLVKTEYRLEKVMFNDILYIEGMRDYRCIYTTTKRILTLQTFTDLEMEIPAQLVCRVHRSFMVSLNRIETLLRDEVRVGDKLIPVSETYKKGLQDKLKL